MNATLNNYLPSENVLVGTTCSSCRVEVFANPSEELAGTLFLNEITAEKTGEFTITVNMANDLPYLSATQTDLDGSTSKFSASWGPVFPISTVTPTPTPMDTPTSLLYLPILLR